MRTSSLRLILPVSLASSLLDILFPLYEPLLGASLNIAHFEPWVAECCRYHIYTEEPCERFLQFAGLPNNLEESLSLASVNCIRVRRIAQNKPSECPCLQIALEAFGIIHGHHEQASHFSQALGVDLTVYWSERADSCPNGDLNCPLHAQTSALTDVYKDPSQRIAHRYQ